MILHELATNAVKYGGLKDEQGSIGLSWSVDFPRNTLSFHWEERSESLAPARQAGAGFGSELLHLLVEKDLGGRLAVASPGSGLLVQIDLPVSGTLLAGTPAANDAKKAKAVELPNFVSV
jgi:two-component sensor histidine kinase